MFSAFGSFELTNLHETAHAISILVNGFSGGLRLQSMPCKDNRVPSYGSIDTFATAQVGSEEEGI